MGVRARVPRPKIKRGRTTARVLGSDHQHHVHVYQGHNMPQFRRSLSKRVSCVPAVEIGGFSPQKHPSGTYPRIGQRYPNRCVGLLECRRTTHEEARALPPAAATERCEPYLIHRNVLSTMNQLHCRIGTKKQTPARSVLVASSNLADRHWLAVEDTRKAS